MKTLLTYSAALVAAAGLSLPASAKDTKGSVPAALEGKLIEAKDETIQDAKIASDKEFYVLYHSASW